MVGIEISVKEQFVEFGNKFFNVKNVEWNDSNDLYYESSTTDPVNKYFIEGEEKINNLLNSLIEIFFQLLAFVKINKTKSSAIEDDIKPIRVRKSLNYTIYFASGRANTTAQYNVSKALLHKLNKELNIAKKKENSGKKFNYCANVKKNQFIDIAENKSNANLNNEVKEIIIRQIKKRLFKKKGMIFLQKK
jgi:hypothetical protein